MNLIKAKLIIDGEVQKVGYRDLAQQIARRLNIKGFVENQKDGTVQIILEAPKEALDEFVKEINVQEDFINVKNIEIAETSPATGEYKYFEVKYGNLDEELCDRVFMIVNVAKAISKDLREVKTGEEGVQKSVGRVQKSEK